MNNKLFNEYPASQTHERNMPLFDPFYYYSLSDFGFHRNKTKDDDEVAIILY